MGRRGLPRTLGSAGPIARTDCYGSCNLGAIASAGAAAATSTIALIVIVFAVIFLGSAALVWRRSRIGNVISIIMSVLFLGLFGFQVSVALTGFADLVTFLEVCIHSLPGAARDSDLLDSGCQAGLAKVCDAQAGANDPGFEPSSRWWSWAS